MKQRFFLAAAALMLSVAPMSWSEDQVTICHFPPGNPANMQIITIGTSAVPFHFSNHAGDAYWNGTSCSAGNGTE